MGTRKETTELKVTGPFTLADLVWIVDQAKAKEISPTSRVEVREVKTFSAMEHEPETITLYGVKA